MLLTIRTTHRPATDLGYLLHKRPDRAQTFDIPAGQAHVFYPEATEEACTAALLLDIDPLGLVRGPGASVSDYVNDRAYAASSFLSVAISRVLGTALSGNCRERPELAATEIPLEARVAAVPCRGQEDLPERLFKPLGYEVEAAGDAGGRYRNLRLAGTKTLSALLNHLYVLVPVLDNRKHYWIGKSELEKLIAHGKGWLEGHPEQGVIVNRYLAYRKSLTEDATARLADEQADGEETAADAPEKAVAHRRLHDKRLDWVVESLREAAPRRVVDVGCGDGKLVRRLADDTPIPEITGADASAHALRIAERRNKAHLGGKTPRVRFLQTGLTYADPALAAFDAAAVVEVVEHVDPERLPAFEEALFGRAQPGRVLLTTPNRDYNVKFEGLADGELRHRDHRFEWTREEFAAWARRVAAEHGYEVEIGGIGEDDPETGPPTQRGTFVRCTKN